MAALAADGIVIGRSTAYFATSLVHETGHVIDGTFASPDNPPPGQGGTSFSATQSWRNAVAADGYAVSAYGAGSYTEDFAEAGRAVLLDVIYPGGLQAFSGNNPNLTQITNQLNAFRSVAGQYYVQGGTCDLGKKYPFPTSFADVAPTATGTPWGQCESFFFVPRFLYLFYTWLHVGVDRDLGDCNWLTVT